MGLFLVALSFTVEGSPQLPAPTAGPTASPRVLATPRDMPAVDTDAVLLQENFADAQKSVLRIYEDDEVRYAIERERYLIEIKQPEVTAWSLVEGEYTNVAIQVEVQSTRSTAATAGGIVFRCRDDANFYLYAVSSEGFYRLELLEDGEWIALIDWTPSEAIVVPTAGYPNVANLLRVEVVDTQIALLVNGILLEKTIDSTFAAGAAGLAAMTFDGGGRVTFDDFVIARLDVER